MITYILRITYDYVYDYVYITYNIDDYVCVRTGERDTLLGGAPESATAAQSTAAPPKSAGAGTSSALVQVRETRPLSLKFRFKNDVFPRQAWDKTNVRKTQQKRGVETHTGRGSGCGWATAHLLVV